MCASHVSGNPEKIIRGRSDFALTSQLIGVISSGAGAPLKLTCYYVNDEINYYSISIILKLTDGIPPAMAGAQVSGTMHYNCVAI